MFIVAIIIKNLCSWWVSDKMLLNFSMLSPLLIKQTKTEVFKGKLKFSGRFDAISSDEPVAWCFRPEMCFHFAQM